MAKTKSCKDCGFHWLNGTGYSDWTWLDTELRCALNKHPEWPKEEPYEGVDPSMAYAEKCNGYDDCSYYGKPPLISPDGDLKEGGERAAWLIRHFAKA